MPTPLTVSRFNSALKTLFPQKKLQQYGLKDQPFYNYLPKGEDFYGRNAEVPIQYSPGARGNSHTFADAQESKGSADYTHFIVTRKRDYKLISLDAEALEASEGDKGAYMSAKAAEVEAAMTQILQQLGADLQGDGTGFIGTVVSVTNATSFVVGDADMVHFELGQRLQAAPSPGFAALRTGTGPFGGVMVVTGVNYDTNTITIGGTESDTTTQVGLTAADRLYPKGNFGLSLTGTRGWIPQDRSTLSTPFNNVDRSVFPSRLAGIFFDGSSFGLAESLERAIARGAKERSFPEECWMNYNRFQDLSLELGARGQRETYGIGQFAYDSIVINGANRKVRVIADQNFQDNDCLMTLKSAWKFWTLKGAPRFLTREAGSELIIEPASDGYELRIGWRGELVCPDPHSNIRVKLPV